MLTIGEFSKLCRVSPKTLRYYDSIDLLKPAYLNKDNDYRYYTIEQLEQILLINKLKEYQFPLIEILNILRRDDDNYLSECMRLKQEEIKREIDKQKNLLKQMKDDINRIKNGDKLISSNINIEIKLVDTKPILILSIRRKIREAEIGQLFNELIPLIEQFNLKAYGSPITIYHDKEYDENRFVDMEIGVPVSNGDNKFITTLNGGLCIFTKYTGNYDGLPSVIKDLYAWKEKENYEIIASPYQKYVKGIMDTESPEEYITEIYLPVRERRE
jgi:DNA-binding transcriptional MerR regulator